MSDQLLAIIVVLPLLVSFFIFFSGWWVKRAYFPLAAAALICCVLLSIGILKSVFSGGVIHYWLGGVETPVGNRILCGPLQCLYAFTDFLS